MCSCIAHKVRWITVVLSNDIAAILPCTVLYVHPKCSHTLFVQYTRVSSWFSHHDIVILASVFYMGKVHTVCIRCVLALHRIYIESRLFYPTISQRSCQSMFNIQEISSCYFTMILYCQQVNFTWEKCVRCALRLQSNIFGSGRPLRIRLHRKVRTVCAYTARFHVETRVFYQTISLRSCHIQHWSCIQNVVMHSMLNIKEFQAAISTLFFIGSKYI